MVLVASQQQTNLSKGSPRVVHKSFKDFDKSCTYVHQYGGTTLNSMAFPNRSRFRRFVERVPRGGNGISETEY